MPYIRESIYNNSSKVSTSIQDRCKQSTFRIPSHACNFILEKNCTWFTSPDYCSFWSLHFVNTGIMKDWIDHVAAPLRHGGKIRNEKPDYYVCLKLKRNRKIRHTIFVFAQTKPVCSWLECQSLSDSEVRSFQRRTRTSLFVIGPQLYIKNESPKSGPVKPLFVCQAGKRQRVVCRNKKKNFYVVCFSFNRVLKNQTCSGHAWLWSPAIEHLATLGRDAEEDTSRPCAY